MKSFKEWLDANPISKPWKLDKDNIVEYWTKLPPGMPLAQVRCIPPHHKGPTLSFDGLRIAGSPNFINFVLSRLKEVLAYENQNTRLQVVYKQQVDNKTQQPVPESYVFYLQVKDRQDKTDLDIPGGFGKIT